MSPLSYSGYRFPRNIVQRAVWMYLRFTLSFRDVEELLAERGITVTYESIRRWVLTFGPAIARRLRARRPKPHGRWHLDEMWILSANSAGCSGGGGGRGAEWNDPIAGRPHTALPRRFCPGSQAHPARSSEFADSIYEMSTYQLRPAWPRRRRASARAGVRSYGGRRG